MVQEEVFNELPLINRHLTNRKLITTTTHTITALRPKQSAEHIIVKFTLTGHTFLSEIDGAEAFGGLGAHSSSRLLKCLPC